MKFKISQQAESYRKRLDRPTKQRIENALLEVLSDPIGASDHLINRGDERSIRVGGLRILFRIVQEESTEDAAQTEIVVIDAILPRGDVYKHTSIRGDDSYRSLTPPLSERSESSEASKMVPTLIEISGRRADGRDGDAHN